MLPILKEQKELLKTLVEDQNDSKTKFEQILRTIENVTSSNSPPQYSSPPELNREVATQTASSSFVVTSLNSYDRAVRGTNDNDQLPWPSRLAHRKEVIEHHCYLIRDLLKQINDVQ